jgi:hypothetical protein
MTPDEWVRKGMNETEHKERAFVSAARRPGRDYPARVSSAVDASKTHFMRTGRLYYLNRRIVETCTTFEELEDDEQFDDPGLILPHGITAEQARDLRDREIALNLGVDPAIFKHARRTGQTSGIASILSQTINESKSTSQSQSTSQGQAPYQNIPQLINEILDAGVNTKRNRRFSPYHKAQVAPALPSGFGPIPCSAASQLPQPVGNLLGNLGYAANNVPIAQPNNDPSVPNPIQALTEEGTPIPSNPKFLLTLFDNLYDDLAQASKHPRPDVNHEPELAHDGLEGLFSETAEQDKDTTIIETAEQNDSDNVLQGLGQSECDNPLHFPLESPFKSTCPNASELSFNIVEPIVDLDLLNNSPFLNFTQTAFSGFVGENYDVHAAIFEDDFPGNEFLQFIDSNEEPIEGEENNGGEGSRQTGN